MDTNFLYVIGPENTGPVKIGFSKHPEKRVKELQTGSSEKYVLHHKVEFEDKKAKLLEALIHKMISYNRVKGEWFNLCPADAILELDHIMIKFEETENNVLRHY
jgi:hypothetical protein